MTQAVLPEDMEEDDIFHMQIGASGWTVPWAMWCDRKRRLWLHPSYTIYREPGGTVQMLVVRTPDGYEVEVPMGEKYHPGSDPGYKDRMDPPYQPVTRLTRRP